MSGSELKEISYYKIDNNALDQLSFGGIEYGLNGCLPPEPLHQLNQGVFKKLVDFFDDCITSVGKDTINIFVKYIAMNSHRQSNRYFPKIDIFKDGIDKVQLTGTEIIYKVFIIYLCLSQTYIIETLPKKEELAAQQYKSRKTKATNATILADDLSHNPSIEAVTVSKKFYKKIGHSKAHLLEWISLFEATLCLDAWVNQTEFSYEDLKCSSKEALDSNADIAVRNYLNLYTKLVKDPLVNGTKTSKIHWILHIPHYILYVVLVKIRQILK